MNSKLAIYEEMVNQMSSELSACDERLQATLNEFSKAKKRIRDLQKEEGLDLSKAAPRKLAPGEIPILNELKPNKICFVSTLFGSPGSLKKLEPFGKIFEKNAGCDYLFFTDVPKDEIPPTSWEIINVNLESFGEMNKVKVSRIFKFQLHKIFDQMDRDYDIVYYCDSFLFPTIQNDWHELFDKDKNIDEEPNIPKNKIDIIQYRHPGNNIMYDVESNISNKKEKKEVIMESVEYLKSLNKSVDLNKCFPYCENTVMAFKISDKKVRNFLDEFWKIYVEIPTYRDQFAWNYMYLRSRIRPIIYKKFRNRFQGKKTIIRHIEEYYS